MTTRIARLIRRRPVTSIFVALLICLSIPPGVGLWIGHDKDVQIQKQQEVTDQVVAELAQQQQAFTDYQVESAVKGCKSSNRGRAALQEVLDRAANPPQTGAATIDFSEIEGFGALDRNTQFFLNNLEVALNVPTSSANLHDIADDYRKTNPSDVDCAKVGNDLREKLEN